MDFKESVSDTLRVESDIISYLNKSIDFSQLEKLAQLIADCSGKVILSGCGTSGTACKKIVHTLNCVEQPSYFLSPAEALHGGLGTLAENDILILVTKGGRTEELDQIFIAAKQKRVKIVAVTENEGSMLARQADLFLKVKVEREPDDFNMLATGSTLAVISLFDAISIYIMRKEKYNKEQFLLNHPGGDVGKKLANR